MDEHQHWERVYRTRSPNEVSWYQPEAAVSLDLIRRVLPKFDAPVIDVGGGASTLVDGLLREGCQAVTVLDIAPSGLAAARHRLGKRAAQAHWVVADALDAPLRVATFAVWHDRAVFHFLTNRYYRERYATQVRHALRPGGFVIVASFGPEGPTRCSGLEVVRYSPDTLHAEFGAGFRLLATEREDHRTPSGRIQPFVYCLCLVEG
jgi:SAM-dependent methyltransferase